MQILRSSTTVVAFLLLLTGFVAADGQRDNNPLEVRRVPREGVPVPAEREAKLREQLASLQTKIVGLKESKNAETIALLPDVTIFERAVRVALDHNEFFSPKDIDKADKILVEGLNRADQLIVGLPTWHLESGLVVRGYVSKIDHTVQPYGLVVPKTYALDNSVPTRCDVWFHGRGETLSEVNFIWDRMKNPGRYTPDHTIVLHPYGRYSNAFKFAGETDVLEALEDVQQRYRIDEDRISVRGFSMGGAACWQFAVHYPDRWFAANPGAGFSETPEFLNFFQQETLNPKPWEKALWNLYDCDKYALNLTHCPTIAYSGENDIQKQAADVMEAALQERGIQLRHIIGANMGHNIDDASKGIIEESMGLLAKQGRQPPSTSLQVLQTHTLKYNTAGGVTIDGLREHWKPASVWLDRKRLTDGKPGRGLSIQATNVSAFHLTIPAGSIPIEIVDEFESGISLEILEFGSNGDQLSFGGALFDGPFSDGSATVMVHRSDTGEWVTGPLPTDGLRKRHNLQGPIDDAFMDSFVFVRPTGNAANDLVGKWADAELDRAIIHWRRHFRGDARVIDDTDLTDEIIASSNVILWGDPASNSVLKKIADRLPIKWTTDAVSVGGKSYDAATHAPILIYPNPLNPNRYVVLNSSFTYRDYAYLNNARQVPMLPDWAVVDLTTAPGYVWPGKVVSADFFDEQWQLKE